MTPAEADQFIIRARRALRQWQAEIDGLFGERREEAVAARDAILGTLVEIANEFPGRRAKIENIAKHCCYRIWTSGA